MMTILTSKLVPLISDISVQISHFLAILALLQYKIRDILLLLKSPFLATSKKTSGTFSFFAQKPLSYFEKCLELFSALIYFAKPTKKALHCYNLEVVVGL